jgi:hypothetical protein
MSRKEKFWSLNVLKDLLGAWQCWCGFRATGKLPCLSNVVVMVGILPFESHSFSFICSVKIMISWNICALTPYQTFIEKCVGGNLVPPHVAG